MHLGFFYALGYIFDKDMLNDKNRYMYQELGTFEQCTFITEHLQFRLIMQPTF